MSLAHLQIQIHGVNPQALPPNERAKVDDFYAARDTTAAPLPWPSIAPPLTTQPRLDPVIRGFLCGVCLGSASRPSPRDLRAPRSEWRNRCCPPTFRFAV
jgi:hypothetical protein